MAIPKYNEMYREFLEALKDGKPHTVKEILAMDPYEFEALVVDLLVRMGYGKLQYNDSLKHSSGSQYCYPLSL